MLGDAGGLPAPGAVGLVPAGVLLPGAGAVGAGTSGRSAGFEPMLIGAGSVTAAGVSGTKRDPAD